MSSNDSKVNQLVAQYSSYHKLHPVFTNLRNDEQMITLIDAALKQEKALIDQRSQNLSDGEINIFQKAFSELCGSKNQLAALGLWVEEILGINTISQNDIAYIVNAAAVGRAALLAGLFDLSYSFSQHRSARAGLTSCVFRRTP